MAITERIPPFSPARIAIVYVVVGSLWILISDLLVNAVIADTALETYAQTVKGLLFVGASALLVYGLVAHSRRELERTNDRLDVAVQQSTILHRILRHNLRNTCNVIRGHTTLLREEVGEDDGALDIIDEATDELVAIGEKTRQLREIVLSDPEATVRLDVVETVESQVATVRERYPAAEIHAELPGGATIETHPSLGTAIYELIENAIEHNDAAEPTVRVSLAARADDVALEIADDGPGLPEMEREVLRAGAEDPTFHSEGVGLWLARTIVVQAGGGLRISDAEPRGTVVGVWLPRTAAAETR